ncbi:MAG: glycine cleavage system protein GcvH [Spirochaetes bacterium]|jgi:glycine cleavage system H protein|nr:glycine cleavage system protein GcvH [Spirochaetota bacterium]
MNFDDSVKYRKSHEWARKDGDLVVVGISDYAQDSLGDVVFVELPEAGATINQGESFGVVESVKSASDLFMPVGGEVAEVNESLSDTPETVNESPFGDGWMIKIKPTDISEYDALLSAADYEEYTNTLEEE